MNTEPQRGRLNIVILVRALAVTAVVGGHLNLFAYGGGGAFILMMLAGYTYAGYLLPKLQQRIVANERQLMLMLKIALPTAAYLMLQQGVSDRPMNWAAVAFYSNLIAPTAHAAWFIEVYLQINVVLFLLAQSDWCARQLARLQDFLPAVAFFLLTVAIAYLSSVMWDTSELWNRVPTRMVWMFAGGILLSASKTPLQRLVFGLCLLAATFIVGDELPFFLAAIVVLTVVHDVSMPAPVAKIITAVAGASLLIYLTHFQWSGLLSYAWPAAPIILKVVAGLAGGILLQYVYNRLWKIFRGRIAAWGSRV